MSFFIHKKEKHIVKMIKKHVDTVVETVCLTIDALNLFLEGKKEESMEYTKQVHRKEHESDTIQHDIDAEMFGGAFMPSIREALFVTVDTVDKVANRAEKLGDFITLIWPEVEHYESEVDRLAWQVLEIIFKELEIEKFSHRMMLREMVVHLSSISNKMEDASDRINIIGLRLKS